MLNRSESGIYYLKKYDKDKNDQSDFTKNTFKDILELRDNKEEAIDYYLNLLKDNLKDYELENFDIITSVPNNDGDNISKGMMKLLKRLSENHENLEFVQCLNREGNTINACSDNLKDKNIILFDYLATQGTSLNACKETLKSAQANLVVCIALEKSSN